MRKARGQALVEFSLVLPVIIVLILGIFDFGRAVFAYNAVSNAAREGMRVGIVNQNDAAIAAEAMAASTGMDPGSLNVTFTPCSGTPALGCMAKVKVTYDWRAITPIIGNVVGPIPLEVEIAMPVERIHSAAP